jgi:ketosteroid isomerase-like protein
MDFAGAGELMTARRAGCRRRLPWLVRLTFAVVVMAISAFGFAASPQAAMVMVETPSDLRPGSLRAAIAASAAKGGTVPCSGPQTRQLVWDFFTAFNRGDLAGLDQLFAPAPAFRWYSSAAPGKRLGAAARHRGTLIPYFSARNAKHDVFNDQRVHLSASAPHWSNFWFEARRAAADFRGGKHFAVVGKGSAICRGKHAQLIVVSVGAPRR